MERLAMPAALFSILLTALVAAAWCAFSLHMLSLIFIEPRAVLNFDAISDTLFGVCFIVFGTWAVQDCLYDMAAGFSWALLRRQIIL